MQVAPDEVLEVGFVEFGGVFVGEVDLRRMDKVGMDGRASAAFARSEDDTTKLFEEPAER